MPPLWCTTLSTKCNRIAFPELCILGAVRRGDRLPRYGIRVREPGDAHRAVCAEWRGSGNGRATAVSVSVMFRRCPGNRHDVPVPILDGARQQCVYAETGRQPLAGSCKPCHPLPHRDGTTGEPIRPADRGAEEVVPPDNTL